MSACRYSPSCDGAAERQRMAVLMHKYQGMD